MPTVHIPEVAVTLVAETCCNCHVVFGIPSELRKRRLDDHQLFYCPNGHGQHFTGKSEAQKLRDELDREKHRAEQAKADADYLRSRVVLKDRQLAARKGQVTRIRNRVEKGVCPCCNRYFANMHRHMESKHPTWKPENDVTPLESDATTR